MGTGTAGRSLLAAAIAILAVGAGAGSASAATARIAYTDFVGGNDQVFTVRADGTHRHQVTNFAHAFPALPAWSPKQKRLVFSVTNGAPSNLFTIRPNGTHLHKIPHTRSGFEPAWSPNGKRIAYGVGNSHGRYAIFTIAPNGRHRKRLTAFKSNISPDWSPTGKSIVFSSVDGVVRMRANGHHKQVVSSNGDEPSWSPNGRLIAFKYRAANPEAVSDIYTVRINGTHRRNLTGARPAAPCPDFPDECRREDEWPAWSPGGRRLLFDETSSGNGDAGIFTVKPNGGGVRHVTTSGHGADW